MIDPQHSSSTRPYLIRAIYEWCTDNGFTPFIAVLVGENVRVPMEFVKDGEIVLNISFDATSALNLGNDYIDFKGRFGGVARDIMVPVNNVRAIYARENGQGMAFPLLTATAASAEVVAPARIDKVAPVTLAPVFAPNAEESHSKPPSGPRPTLKRIK